MNSSAIGNYADYLTLELIPLIDREYRQVFGWIRRDDTRNEAWALMEMQLIVATVAQKYRPHLAHGCLVAAEAGIVLRPKGRFLMALERRGER